MKRDDVILVRGQETSPPAPSIMWSVDGASCSRQSILPPSAARSLVSEAVYEGGAVGGGNACVLVKTLDEAVVVWQRGDVPVMVDPEGELIRENACRAVDAILG